MAGTSQDKPGHDKHVCRSTWKMLLASVQAVSARIRTGTAARAIDRGRREGLPAGRGRGYGSPMRPWPGPSDKRGYHHGNLREALIEVAQRFIAERGLGGFTLADAAKLVGVSPDRPLSPLSRPRGPRGRGRRPRLRSPGRAPGARVA